MLGRLTERREAGPRALLAVGFGGVVVLLFGVAALASRSPLSGSATAIGSSSTARERTTAAPDALGLLVLAAGVALLGLVVFVRWSASGRREPEPYPEQPPFRAPWLIPSGVVLIPLLICALLVAAAIDGSHTRISPHGSSGLSAPVAGHATVRSSRGASSFSPPSWLPPALVGLTAACGAVLAALLIVRRREMSHTPSVPTPVLNEAVERSIAELQLSSDPRMAVIAAYRRMESALADAGVARHESEAPREYRTRVLSSLGVSAEPIRSLTGLYERARFSPHPVAPPLRDAALQALVAIREQLRTPRANEPIGA